MRKGDNIISFVDMRKTRDIREGQLVCFGRENKERSK